MDNARYQKDLEKRIDELQERLITECTCHDATDKKFHKIFHNLLRDMHVINQVTTILKGSGDDPATVVIDRRIAEDMISMLTKLHDKYTDKSYAFMREIINKE